MQNLRWGIIATGAISTEFAKDLLVDPSTRGVCDVSHSIVAVGSRSITSAERFIESLRSASSAEGWSWGVEQGKLNEVKAYGTYAEAYTDPNADVIYIGTPPLSHHRNVKDALLAGKHVLCEKPFTFDLEELDELIRIAKENKLFLMEAVWTRFHPLAAEIAKIIDSGRLGKPQRFSADYSVDWSPDNQPLTHRKLDPVLGGGSLLDMGPYPCVWAMLLVHKNPYNRDSDPKVVFSHQTLYERVDVDLNSRWLIQWDSLCQGVLSTDLSASGQREATAVLQCEEGDLAIHYPPYRAETFSIVPRPDRFLGKIKEKTTHHHPIATGNNGLAYEADEVARCLREGKFESEKMPLRESRITQGWLDEVRKNGPTPLACMKGTAGQ